MEKPPIVVKHAAIPPETRIAVSFGKTVQIPFFDDFAVMTTHGEMQDTIAKLRSSPLTAVGLESLVQALAKYSRSELVAMAEQPSPSGEWGSWCTDAILFVAHKHVMDGQPIHVVRLGHATAEKCLKKKDGQHE